MLIRLPPISTLISPVCVSESTLSLRLLVPVASLLELPGMLRIVTISEIANPPFSSFFSTGFRLAGPLARPFRTSPNVSFFSSSSPSASTGFGAGFGFTGGGPPNNPPPAPKFNLFSKFALNAEILPGPPRTGTRPLAGLGGTTGFPFQTSPSFFGSARRGDCVRPGSKTSPLVALVPALSSSLRTSPSTGGLCAKIGSVGS
ncbi:hypothetical protein SAICODRAFT_32241 [Saitoella complicata NRRL Y-17804]|uniref:uncharacterized protein n=1 Tax=Saitoella complicata (strain BCRC 22490 / CBS 7301 / JCM 7358 / NBRC 10748 / NRRL Y-17804) TaxID=698492 RepID=UPI000866956D|nr:uncharacterized protein SAICODRAFT_32241 [Saitoella complicata NRRL Y-17804]ODQ49947.1 hypothetical protein SAICODRAFT_32241 [Saitoella complicata NRRL Y-17804]